MYSYDLATITSVLPAFANAKDTIVCDEVPPCNGARQTAWLDAARLWMQQQYLPVPCCAVVVGASCTESAQQAGTLVRTRLMACWAVSTAAPHRAAQGGASC